MKEKITLQLKAKLETLGVKNLSQARIDAIADKLATKITDESEIDAKLDELNDLHPFAELAKYDDWQRSKQKKTEQPKTPKQEESTDEPDLKTMFTSLQKEIESLKKEKQTQALQDTLLKKVSEKKIPAAFIKGRTLESEDQLDTVLADIEADFTAVKQELVNQGFSQSSTPVGGTTTLKSDNVENDIKSWAGKDKK